MKLFWTFAGSEIIEMCEQDSLYTRGSNEEYEAMLEKARHGGLTMEQVIEVAKDIYSHSTPTNGEEADTMYIAQRLLNRGYTSLEI